MSKVEQYSDSDSESESESEEEEEQSNGASSDESEAPKEEKVEVPSNFPLYQRLAKQSDPEVVSAAAQERVQRKRRVERAKGTHAPTYPRSAYFILSHTFITSIASSSQHWMLTYFLYFLSFLLFLAFLYSCVSVLLCSRSISAQTGERRRRRRRSSSTRRGARMHLQRCAATSPSDGKSKST
jgi:hypothetical protein